VTDELYQQAILGKARDAVGAGTLDDPDAVATVNNPVCGDRVTMEVKMSDGQVVAVAHKVRGCVLCEAAASVVGANAPGATRAEVDAARTALSALLREGQPIPKESWSDLSMFQPVTAHKSRHHCVQLPFEALTRALDEADRE
jgi:nitrogen fixation NifU-like protein